MSNVALQLYFEEVEKMILSDFTDEKRATIWRNLDDSWNWYKAGTTVEFVASAQ